MSDEKRRRCGNVIQIYSIRMLRKKEKNLELCRNFIYITVQWNLQCFLLLILIPLLLLSSFIPFVHSQWTFLMHTFLVHTIPSIPCQFIQINIFILQFVLLLYVWEFIWVSHSVSYVHEMQFWWRSLGNVMEI